MKILVECSCPSRHAIVPDIEQGMDGNTVKLHDIADDEGSGAEQPVSVGALYPFVHLSSRENGCNACTLTKWVENKETIQHNVHFQENPKTSGGRDSAG